MAEAEPLFALLEIMLRTFNVTVPKMKPGGYPDDIFLGIPDDEREELECSICYQVIKEARQCINNHTFCYSCIFVWSTSGNPVNHGRCPVCRADGNYIRNKELDERINRLKVKCSTKGCRWEGPLRHQPSHQHTTYSEPADTNSSELPALSTNSSNARSRASTLTKSSSSPLTPTFLQTSTNANQQRRPLASVSNNASQSRSSSVNQRQGNSQSTNRTRHRSRSRTNSTSQSPQRRITTTATGLNTRLTSRARIQNGPLLSTTAASQQSDENDHNEAVSQTTEPQLTPRPPVTPRPQGSVRRRVPTLPNLMNSNNSNDISNSYSSDHSNIATDSNNNISENDNSSEPDILSARRNPLEGSLSRRVAGTSRNFANVRDRLNESRHRLDMLMNAFSVELDRGRHDLTAFQQERERRRQEQLAEVRDLGIRLGQVATELRGLLSQRRQIRNQIDHLVESSSTDDIN